jgi:hypothetical protein
MNGAESPERISKFLPSKVIIRGTTLFINNNKRTISTAILIVCSQLKVSGLNLSINLLPDLVTNNIMIAIRAGPGNSINLGGKPLVLV